MVKFAEALDNLQKYLSISFSKVNWANKNFVGSFGLEFWRVLIGKGRFTPKETTRHNGHKILNQTTLEQTTFFGFEISVEDVDLFTFLFITARNYPMNLHMARLLFSRTFKYLYWFDTPWSLS